jgi:ABC-type antimicrobial peptide transport system permease subunit
MEELAAIYALKGDEENASKYRNKIKIVKGTKPNNDYEVIVNNNLKDMFKLNKYIDEIKINGNKLKVVGYYESEDDINSYFVNSNTKKYEYIENSRGITVFGFDKNLVKNSFLDKDIVLLDSYNTDRDNYISEQKESIKSSIIVALVILIISLIEIVLMMRSSFLSRIKEVGIYRAIGVKKTDIYKMFIGESFAISTLASLPGVLFISYCLYVLSDINYINNNYEMNLGIIFLCLIIVYSFNIIVGLIPVFNIIKKTPAEILSRNDLD